MSKTQFTPDTYSRAVRFAANAHSGQRYPSSGLPYLVHLVEVAFEITNALIYAPMTDPELAIQCALLHDTLEDTSVTEAVLKAEFGPAVAKGVKALSKDPKLPTSLAMVDSLNRIKQQPVEVQAVKMADRIVNLQAPPIHWDKPKIQSYHLEAISIHQALHPANAYLSERLLMRIEDYKMYL